MRDGGCVMKINIVDIRHEAGASRDINEEVSVAMDSEGRQQKISFSGSISNVGKTFLLRGSMSATVMLSCVRCLEAFPYKEDIFIEEEYTERPPSYTSEMYWNTDELNVFSGNVIDISDVLRDTLLLHLPMQPVCKESCAGFCQSCGKNLNEEACGCPKDAVDVRFEKLKSLLEK